MTLFEKIKANGDIVCGDDGFYVFWPSENKGAMNEDNLREIANGLEELNAPWQDKLKEYWENKNV